VHRHLLSVLCRDCASALLHLTIMLRLLLLLLWRQPRLLLHCGVCLCVT
jgi:hypothetical protein